MKQGPKTANERVEILAKAYEEQFDKITFFEDEQTGTITPEGCALIKALFKVMELEDEMESKEEAAHHHKHKHHHRKHHHHQAHNATTPVETLDTTVQKEKKLGYKRY